MSSPAWSPRPMVTTTTSQASVSGEAATLASQTPAAPSPTPSPSPSVGSQTPNSPSTNANNYVQETDQAKFATPPSYVGPPPSFSYGVTPKSSSTSGSSQDTSSNPVVNSSPPVSEAAVQPVASSPSFSYNIASSNNVPSSNGQQSQSSNVVNSSPPVSEAAVQPVASSPSFSYNIASSNNVPSSNGQQSQASNDIGLCQSQGGKSSTPTSSPSMQHPVLGKSGHTNLYVPGTTTQNIPDPSHSPVPIPKDAPSIAAGFSFSRPSQLPAVADALHGDPSSYSNASTATAREAGTSARPPTSLPSVSLPGPPSYGSSTVSHATPSLYPATMWMPTTSHFPAHPGQAGSPATPGPPGIPLTGSFPSAITARSMAPIMPLSATVPPHFSAQQQMYPPFQPLPGMVPPPQTHWLQPPQLVGMQRPPYQPYPAVISNHYPVPVRGSAHPSVSLPDSQPPGVPPVATPGGSLPSSVGSVQLVTNSTLQSESGTGIEHDNKNNSNEGPVNNEEVDAWTAHKTDTGAVYYYNAVTGESTYEKPQGFKGEPDKVTVQSTPVSWEKLAGTDWALVTTDDGKKYYYNTKTKVSSWQIPMEVTELLKKKQEGDPVRENTMSVQNTSTLPEKGSVSISLSTPAVNTGGRDAAALRPPVVPGSSSALDLIKKKLQDSGMPVASSSLPASSGPSISDANAIKAIDAVNKGPQGESSKDKQKDVDGDGTLSDSSSDSEDVESGPTKEECLLQFKEMLKERGIAPFSKWEKELPKIVFDPRFKAVSSPSARRSLFEHYVRTRAEEERKEKRAAQKAAIEGFKQLLDEASEDFDHKTDYHSFKRKWGSDPRFEALDRKERETLLNERILPLRKAAEEKTKAIRAAAVSSFKSMLQDKKDINSHTRWSRVKDSLRNDPRYKSVKHEDREILFNEYISELRAAEEELQRVVKAKREEQDKLKEREREMRKRKERDEQEMERARLKVRRKEAVSSYQTLLVEMIKDPQASWTESKPKLEKDPQGRATNPDLDQADTEKLFREHVRSLYERCMREFQALLAEVLNTEEAAQVAEDGKSALTSWSTAKRLLKSDVRYSKMLRKDRESLWRRYAEEIQRKRKLTSDPAEEKLHTEKKSRTTLDPGRSPVGSRRVRERR